GVMENGVFKPTSIGTPQGGVVSPLLANVTLNSLDWHFEKLGMRFVRYADDFVVLCRSRTKAQEALTMLQSWLPEQLGLHLSEEKTKVRSFSEGFDFLGFTISSRSVRMRTKSVEKFKTKVRDITCRTHNLDADLLERLNRVIRGTANYFATSFSSCVTLFRNLDAWIRMRLRCCKLKRKWHTDNKRV